MAKKRPVETLVPALQHELVERFTKIRGSAERRESHIYRDLLKAVVDLAKRTSPENSVAEYRDTIRLNSATITCPQTTVEFHLTEALRHFGEEKPQNSGITHDGPQKDLALHHMRLAIKDVGLGGIYTRHISAAEANRKKGTATPTDHLVSAIARLSESTQSFAMKVMELIPDYEAKRAVFETLATEGRGGLAHKLGATMAQQARRPAQLN